MSDISFEIFFNLLECTLGVLDWYFFFLLGNWFTVFDFQTIDFFFFFFLLESLIPFLRLEFIIFYILLFEFYIGEEFCFCNSF